MTQIEIHAREVEQVVREIAAAQHGVLSARQLLAGGIGSRRLRALIDRGVVERLSESVYRFAGSTHNDFQSVLAGLLDAPPGAVASHQTAAALWNLPGFDLRGDVHVTIPRQGATQRRRLAVVHYQKDMPLSEVVLRHGIPTASPTLAIFHLCAVLHPGRVERAFDQATVRRLTSGKRLAGLVIAIGARGRNGSRLARELAKRHADQPPPESGLEHRVEWLAGGAGVELDRQVEVGDGHLVGRADFRLRGTMGLLEAQSVLYHSSPMDSAHDQVRMAALMAAGFSVLTIWDYQAFHHADSVIEAIGDFRRDLEAGRPPFHLDCLAS